MLTKTLKASSLALVAVATFATVASTPASANGRIGYGGHGPVRTNFGGGFHRPVHGPGSSHNPIIYRVPPWIPIFPVNGGPKKGGPKMGEPTRGWGGGRGYGVDRGFGRGYGVGSGVVYSGGTACPTHFHWSPKFLRCIPNYV